MPNTYDVRCPRCRALLAKMTGWGLEIRTGKAIARFQTGEVECGRCEDVRVSFREPPRDAELKSLQ